MVTFSSLWVSCSAYVLACAAGGGLKCFSLNASDVSRAMQAAIRTALTSLIISKARSKFAQLRSFHRMSKVLHVCLLQFAFVGRGAAFAAVVARPDAACGQVSLRPA